MDLWPSSIVSFFSVRWPSLDVRIWRLKTLPALRRLINSNSQSQKVIIGDKFVGLNFIKNSKLKNPIPLKWRLNGGIRGLGSAGMQKWSSKCLDQTLVNCEAPPVSVILILDLISMTVQGLPSMCPLREHSHRLLMGDCQGITFTARLNDWVLRLSGSQGNT